MDNTNYHSPTVPNFDNLPPVDNELDKPIPLDLDEPITLGGGGPSNADVVSHTPLNLGGPAAAAAPAPSGPAPAARPLAPGGSGTARPSAAPAAPAQVQMRKGAVKPVGPKLVSSERITGVKTFFTKLHPGALEFLDEQICTWLKRNPGISIKHTNITTGDVQSKKTEPNIIITVWY